MVSDGIKLLKVSSKEMMTDEALINNYIRNWEKAFEREGYRERIKWLFKAKASVALAVNKYGEIIGGLNKHRIKHEEFCLFNNLFSVKGKSSIPLAVPLIKSLMEDEELPCIGFPNRKARIPYKRAGFKLNKEFNRTTISTSSYNKSTKGYKIIKISDSNNIKDIYEKTLTTTREVAFMSWRYRNNWEGKKYSIIMEEENDYTEGGYAIISEYSKLKRIHILNMQYKDEEQAMSIINCICSHGVKIGYNTVDIVLNYSSERGLMNGYTIINKEYPIITYNMHENENKLIIRDGDNDVY